LEVFSDQAMQGVSQHSRIEARGVHLLRSMAEEHVVGMFLTHILSLIATVMPFSCPGETGVGSSGTVYTSAFTLAFFFLTTCRHEACVSVVERKECESLWGPMVFLCCRRHGRMTWGTFDPSGLVGWLSRLLHL
jgi:hypothetical protein